jgi:hypothetical protein
VTSPTTPARSARKTAGPDSGRSTPGASTSTSTRISAAAASAHAAIAAIAAKGTTALEPRASLGVSGERRRQELQRHGAPQLLVARLVYDPHPAGARGTHDLEMGNALHSHASDYRNGGRAGHARCARSGR